MLKNFFKILFQSNINLYYVLNILFGLLHSEIDYLCWPSEISVLNVYSTGKSILNFWICLCCTMIKEKHRPQ